MEASQRKNVILIAVAVLLMLGAVVFGFRESIFSSGSAASIDGATAAAVAETMGTDNQPEPGRPDPPPRGSGKVPATK